VQRLFLKAERMEFQNRNRKFSEIPERTGESVRILTGEAKMRKILAKLKEIRILTAAID
jgi:hypothetical protein